MLRLLALSAMLAVVQCTELTISLSKEEVTYGDTLVINVSVTLGNEMAEQPVLEILLPPKLHFTTATVRRAVCGSPMGDCTVESLAYKADDGELMGKFSLGDKVIKATRSFAITKESAAVWHQGFVYKSVMQLENVSAPSLDDNSEFAICVFRYWKKPSEPSADKAYTERSSAKYFLLHSVNVSLLAIGDQSPPGTPLRISSQKLVQLKLTAHIDSGAGNVVLKLTIPGQLLVEKSAYGLGHNPMDAAVMQVRNQTANTADLYVLITPSMIATAGDNSAILIVTLRAREDQANMEVAVLGSVLYGSTFQHQAAARPILLSIVPSLSNVQREDNGPKLPPKTVIEYAPAVHKEPVPPRNGPLLDEGQKNASLSNGTLIPGPQNGPLANSSISTTASVSTVAMATNGTSLTINESSSQATTPLPGINSTMKAIPILGGPAQAMSILMDNDTDMAPQGNATGPVIMLAPLDTNGTTPVQTGSTNQSTPKPISTSTPQPSSPVLENNDDDVDSAPPLASTGEHLPFLFYSPSSHPSYLSEPCDQGWWSLSMLLSDCYYFPNQALAYSDAEFVCESRGSHLVSLHSVYDFLAFSTFW